MKVTMVTCIAFALSLSYLGLCECAGFELETDVVSVRTTYTPADCETRSKSGDKITIHFVASVGEDGKGPVFEDTWRSEQPIQFDLGTGAVSRSLDEGLVDMCVGERRILVIPSTAFAENPDPELFPEGASAYFDVELMSIGTDTPETPERQVNLWRVLMDQADLNGDKMLDRQELYVFTKSQGSNMYLRQEVIHAMNVEDSDKDGFVTWDEYTGPKGSHPDDEYWL